MTSSDVVFGWQQVTLAVLFKKVNTLSKKSTDVVFDFPEFDRQNQDLLKSIYLD